MINCTLGDFRDIMSGENKIGEVAESMKCDFDPEGNYFETIVNGDQQYHILKFVTPGDLVIFWFATLFVVGFLVMFVIKFVRNKNVF